jgi:hypothetical protein
MGKTLYLLRHSPDRISSSIFRADDVDMDIVLVDQAASTISASVKDYVVVDEGMAGEPSYPTVTYDDLIEKIFSNEHVIVV